MKVKSKAAVLKTSQDTFLEYLLRIQKEIRSGLSAAMGVNN